MGQILYAKLLDLEQEQGIEGIPWDQLDAKTQCAWDDLGEHVDNLLKDEYKKGIQHGT